MTAEPRRPSFADNSGLHAAMKFLDWVRRLGRGGGRFRRAAPVVLALAICGPAATAPHFKSYDGVDQTQIPQELRRFFTPRGFNVLGIRIYNSNFDYRVERRFTTPWPEWPHGVDYVSVNVTFFDTPEQADAAFDVNRKNADRLCADGTREIGRCVPQPLGPNIYGAAAIFDESVRKTEHKPQVGDAYAIRVRGAENGVIWITGFSNSNWTNPDTPTKAIAMGLAGVDGGPAAPKPAVRTPPPLAAAGSVTAARIQAVSDARWSQRPTLPEAEETVSGRNDFIVFRGNDGRFDCLPKVPNLPGPTRAPGGDFRLLEARELMLTALRGMGLSEADIAAILEGSNASGAKIPAAVRERAYMLWRPGRVSHYLYGAQLVLSPEQGGGVQPAEFELPQEPCPLASSEHSSVRGTINGGGDFIGFRRIPGGVRRPMLIRAAFDRPPLAGPGTVVETPGAVVTLGADAVAAIDLAPNGVAAVALLAGSGSLAEIESGAQRRLAPGTVAVSVPGLGVSPPIALPADSRDALEAIAAAPAAGPAHPTPEVHRDPAAGYEFSIPPGWEEGGGTQGFNLVNPADQTAFQVVVQNNDEPIPADQLYAGVAEVFRTDPDYELVRAGPRRLTSIGRDGYAFLLRSRADGRALAVISAPRDIGPRSRDFYILKIRWPGPDGQAAVEALERLLTGFRIID